VALTTYSRCDCVALTTYSRCDWTAISRREWDYEWFACVSKQPITSKPLHVAFSYIPYMYMWSVNQAASEWGRGVSRVATHSNDLLCTYGSICGVVLRKLGWLEAEFGETAWKFPFLVSLQPFWVNIELILPYFFLNPRNCLAKVLWQWHNTVFSLWNQKWQKHPENSLLPVCSFCHHVMFTLARFMTWISHITLSRFMTLILLDGSKVPVDNPNSSNRTRYNYFIGS
jgi:hypothetical protein